MKPTALAALLLTSVLCCVTFSCEDPDDPTGTPDDTARIAATVDGESYEVTGILVTGTLIDGGSVNSLAVGGSTLPFGGITEGFALGLIHADGTAFAPGQTFETSSTTSVAACEYLLESFLDDIRAESENTGVGQITLTAFDTVNNVASGTFWFDGADDDDPATVYQIRDGVFENVPFD